MKTMATPNAIAYRTPKARTDNPGDGMEAPSYRRERRGRPRGAWPTLGFVAPSVHVPMLDAAPVVVRSGRTTVVAAEPVEVVAAWGDDALDALDRLTPGWWAGVLSYDLGRSIERVVPRHGEEQLLGDRVVEEDRGVPDVLLARYDARLVVAGGEVGFEGRRAATHRLERLLTRAPTPAAPVPLGTATSSLDRDEYEAGVAAIIELIEAGECYQVNLTRRLTWDRAADGRALHHALATRNPAPHAGLFALPRPRCGPAGRRVGVARAISLVARPRRRDASDQGHSTARRAAHGQHEGPRRERDDRRPRATTSGASASSVPSTSRRCVRSSITQGCTTS